MAILHFDVLGYFYPKICQHMNWLTPSGSFFGKLFIVLYIYIYIHKTIHILHEIDNILMIFESL